MTSPKKTTAIPRPPTWLAKTVRFLWGPGRPAFLLVLVVGAFAGSVFAAWSYVRPYLITSGQFAVTVDRVHLTPQPEWIRPDVRDIRAEVFRDANLGSLFILDDNVAERIHNAFALHPWVAKVVRVEKRPGGVEVELVYRRPVCMVQVRDGLMPVDAEGVLLPSGDFAENVKQAYPHLVGIDTSPVGAVGQRWGDRRVADGAEIVMAIGANWETLKLQRITPLATGAARATEQGAFDLITRGGTHIFWGFAPSVKTANELPAAEKLGRLLQYQADHENTLDGRGGPQQLDVRSLPSRKAT
jgi:cell division septal protein FtsQ